MTRYIREPFRPSSAVAVLAVLFLAAIVLTVLGLVFS